MRGCPVTNLLLLIDADPRSTGIITGRSGTIVSVETKERKV